VDLPFLDQLELFYSNPFIGVLFPNGVSLYFRLAAPMSDFGPIKQYLKTLSYD